MRLVLLDVTKDSLISALQHVLKAVSTNSLIPVLTGINVQAYAKELIFTASNASMTIQYRIPQDSRTMTVQRTGGIVVPARYFYEIIRKSDAGFIGLEIRDRLILVITSGNSQIRLSGMDPSEFPSINQVESPTLKLRINSALLNSSIKQVAASVSTSETRPVLTGVYFDYSDERLRLIATDGVRLASRTIAAENHGNPGVHVIIPGKNLYEAAKILNDENNTTEIVVDDRQIRFIANHIQVRSSLIDGAYPSIKNVIPKTYLSEVIAETACLRNAIERATVLASESIIRLTAISNKIDLLSRTAEIGEVRDEVPLKELNGEAFTISLNGKFFTDLLRCMDSEYVRLRFTGKISPIVIQPLDDPSSALFLITPVRTPD